MRVRENQGFSLIELMIALVVLGVITAQMFLVFTTQRKAYVTNERILDIQEDARLVMDLLVTESRMAGYMVPRRLGLSSRNGGASASDALCISDASAIADSEVTGANDRFRGADVGLIDPNGTGGIQVASAADLDIDGDGTDDFAPSQGIIIADLNSSHCAKIDDAYAPGNVNITVDPPFNVADFTAGSTQVIPAVIYEVDAQGLHRNDMLMSPEVEDLQIEMGLDVNNDNLIDTSDTSVEFPLDSIDGLDAQFLRTMRLTVITRTDQVDLECGTACSGRPAAGDRTAGAADGRRRRRFVATVAPRNLR